MLVLSRKAGEEIVVSNGDITISVLGITGKKVRLGVSAPSKIPVHRKEVRHRITQRIKPETDSNEAASRVLRQFVGPTQSNAQPNTGAGLDRMDLRG